MSVAILKNEALLVKLLYKNDEITAFHSKNLRREPIALRALHVIVIMKKFERTMIIEFICEPCTCKRCRYGRCTLVWLWKQLARLYIVLWVYYLFLMLLICPILSFGTWCDLPWIILLTKSRVFTSYNDGERWSYCETFALRCELQ